MNDPRMDLPPPDYQRNMRQIGHSDQGGRADGMQIMVHRGHAYVAHMFSGGFSVLDVRDPTRPRTVSHTPAPPNTWNIHLQTHDDLLLVVNARDMFSAAEFQDERAYYSGSIGRKTGISEMTAQSKTDWTAGMSVHDISTPGAPRPIGFMPVDGGGIHRIWYTGGRWAYASALLNGFSDYILITIDMSDPAHPREAGRCWLPGMHLAAGETPPWPASRRCGLHHAIVHGDLAYAAWRDAGMAVIDVSDRAAPRVVLHRDGSPPFGGGTHNCLPLPDRELLVVLDEAVMDNQEDGPKNIWLMDNREPSNPVTLSTVPMPGDADYVRKGGHFGPHNLHENRPGSFISSEMIFTTYQNAGVRVFDIRDAHAPVEVGAFVPGAPSGMVDRRPGRPRVIQSGDVFVSADGLLYATDYNQGLSILEFGG